MLYHYKATIKRIIDGDTIVVVADLGFTISVELYLRVKGINTPEVVGEERARGLEAKAFVEHLLPVGSPVTIITYKDRKEKYGRYLAEVRFLRDGEEKDLATLLLNAGLAAVTSS